MFTTLFLLRRYSTNKFKDEWINYLVSNSKGENFKQHKSDSVAV